jgi:hypothetical protein
MQSTWGLLLAAVLVLQNPSIVTLYDQPIDDQHRLRVVTDSSYRIPPIQVPQPIEAFPPLDVLLVDRQDANRVWKLATMPAVREDASLYAVVRADASSVVFSRKGNYDIEVDSIKLFFDIQSKRERKRITFNPSAEVVFPSDAEAQRILNVSPAGLRLLRDQRVFRGTYDSPPNPAADRYELRLRLPEPLTKHPLPQTSLAEFARARPAQIRRHPDQSAAAIQERIGAYQVVGDRIWVGKAFYDGEGLNGVGAIGYLDAGGTYTFLAIPELFDWSVLGFLIEDDTAWVGMVNYPEGATNSGGLLQYDLNMGRAQVHSIPDVIHSIVRVEGALFLGTTKGVYILRDGRITRHRAEPDINGRFIVISENL